MHVKGMKKMPPKMPAVTGDKGRKGPAMPPVKPPKRGGY